MTVKICENIAKYRKMCNVTQTELADYLGVSPQAVSKWEQQISVPDVYLLPKIAFFFQVSIDTLFGNSDLDVISLLVSKYESTCSEKDYREAKASLEMILETEPENGRALELLCKLEYYKALEYLNKSKEICRKLQVVSESEDETLNHRANVQMIRFERIFDDYEEFQKYEDKFEQTRSGRDFNYWIIALCAQHRYEEVLALADKCGSNFSEAELAEIYPNIMEAAYCLNNVTCAEKCFRYITEHVEDKAQIFNAWWLLYKIYQKNGRSEAGQCRDELQKQLPLQGCNAYVLEKLKQQLQDEKGNSGNVL